MNSTFNKINLPIKLSSRISLTEDERQKLLNSYNEQPEQGELNVKLGMSKPAFMEIIRGRDSISVPFLLKIQSTLGIEIVSKDRLNQSCSDYVEHIYSKTRDVIERL